MLIAIQIKKLRNAKKISKKNTQSQIRFVAGWVSFKDLEYKKGNSKNKSKVNWI